MGRRLRIVADSGVLISAAISTGGHPQQVLAAWSAGRIELIVSPRLLAELNRVFRRDKFRKYLALATADRYVLLLRREADLRADPIDAIRVSRDPDDDYLLALAASTSADFLVSGDPHLTELTDVQPPVVTPTRLVEDLQKRS